VKLVKSDQSGTVRELPMINGGDGQTSFPTWSLDGAYLGFSSNRSGGAGGWDVYVAPIDPVTGIDGPPANVASANSAGFEHAAQWSP
jgi:Tol biopolymer transport system component